MPFKNNPGCNCCGCDCIDQTNCSQCASMKLRWTFSVAGVTNNDCTDCTDWNGDWGLCHTGSCAYNTIEEHGTHSLCSGSGTAHYFLDYNVPNDEWRLNAQAGVIMRQWTLAGASWNCTGSNVMSDAGGSSDCSNWPASVTVSPCA